MGSNINHLIWIKIKAHNRIIALGFCWFLLNAEAITFLVKFGYTITFRIIHPVTEYRCLLLFIGCSNSLFEHLCETITLEDIITQHKASGIIANEVLANGKCLCEAIG